MRKLWRRLYFFLHQRQLERELAEEMESHREMMPPERRGRFGNPTRLREESREAWLWTWLEQVLQDLSYALRVLRHAPGFTLGAVAVLALGVGVNLAELQIFDAVTHRLHIREAKSVLEFSRVSRSRQTRAFPAAAVEMYRVKNRSFAWLAGEDYLPVVVEADADVGAELVTSDYFRNIGVVPGWGRLLEPRDAQPSAPPVAVLNYAYWKAKWGADPHVIGRIIHVNNQPVQVVGVAPSDFGGLLGGRIEMWVPITLRPLLVAGSPPSEQDFSRPLWLAGKLKPGVSLAAGEAELTALTRELARSYRALAEDERVRGQFLQKSLLQNAERTPAVAIFVIIVLLVLVSACANLGNMLLARGLVREREIQIRAAIGASRARVVRQLMTENLLLALLGAAAGVGFGQISARLLLVAIDAPGEIKTTITWPIAVAGLVLTLFSALIFGLPSALQTVRTGPRKASLRQGLVGEQVAVSCLLLIASGVLAHNGIAAASVNLAYDYQNMAVVYPGSLLGLKGNLASSTVQQRMNALATRLGALPGVDGITSATAPPPGPPPIDSLPGLPAIYRNTVAPSYFEVMKLPAVLGRTFAAGEQDVAVVSESAARAIWPNQNPLGKSLKLAGADRTVVGVVKNSGATLLWDAGAVEAYLPLQGAAPLILHTRTDPSAVVRSIPAVAAELKETAGVSLMRATRDSYRDGQRQLITLIGSVGAVATALAAAGMFALVAFAVAQRKRELGIRIAIGATPRQILGVLLEQSAKPTAVGVLAGAVLAAVLSRIVGSFVRFYAINRHETVDVPGFAAGIAAFVLVAILATLSPARRALRIDPAATLREE